ncbi:MAG: hypothetical protein LBC64_08940 [Fibromonadaceae bacterium]|jgi:hypothetical protein|nr:hypothetical protein [Fibromonadaceae bacterium]
MKEISMNHVIWLAIKNLKRLVEPGDFKRPSIDAIFSACEKELCALDASEREINLRLFALALYCHKIYSSDFLKSAAFARFSEALDYYHFRNTAKMLIRENNYALVVFWVVFRLSFVNTIPQDDYLPLEQELQDKSLELGMNLLY